MKGFESVLAGVFGVGWTVLASSMGAPLIITLFGVVFIVFALSQAVYNFVNAAGRNRFSDFDITGEKEEPDPLNRRFGYRLSRQGAVEAGSFCPYCGEEVEDGYRYCRKCGRELPEK